MAHTKAGGATRQKGNRRGKHLGVKIFGGQKVSSGNILVRQKGSIFHAGQGVKVGRDFTLFAVKSGEVKFLRQRGRQLVSVQ
ncbi:50S ribosomal protein L27 [Candidatus Amesbacteria bacterium RIFCSPLOWO2_02_FULL_48_11]|uniref:Large ribosomal subunit protein bL27 n=4 Tax=Candidatus Amesiibacteriota TaxID=1752730 RepID=A0A1F4Z929_9BACT|nr:MAG: 50S ribosomal protein L27, large subunit ribosomal protein L27 [Candidatus Amesbacteria bacterium GW2011_GWC1_48_10]KKW00692.1 MAG: 50S ribosomal protein L27 [Candidatus Amesbacteria bacterium GW2011_GWA1_48_9]OGC90312.1 MAG: 50S ribosomal protein L27 [Candidatus Amesbacteria bacterium RBG_19FT_COMBO_48_16]OGC96359.1 MAG: 50S ribosomal protein L27 [Candidatus Amesbacteria bacterium RIFCSPHIGHO2_02_FULL_48_21]OGC98592.1 MAG: 50S ribosomal protein L27 [Candidatus Amesbacteria bacterium RB